MRTCILNGQRKDMFKGTFIHPIRYRADKHYILINLVFLVKRALRALESPAYAKARSKNPLLPEITDRASLENTSSSYLSHYWLSEFPRPIHMKDATAPRRPQDEACKRTVDGES